MPHSSAAGERSDAARLRIACLIWLTIPGGAQRVIAHLCNHFAAEGHEVALLTFELEGTAPFFPLDDRVRFVPLGCVPGPGVLARVRRLARWLQAIRRNIVSMRPHVVISFICHTNIMVLLATRGLGIPVIVSERIDPHHHPVDQVWAILRRLTYPRASRIVVQTARAARYFADTPTSRLVVLANPVPPAAAMAAPERMVGNGRWRIIGVGRLNRQKGFDLLVAAFARIAPRFPDWEVAIFGDGSEKAALQAAIDAQGLSDRFKLLPSTTEIAAELAASHVFAFPSRYEGFPNALAEALAAGLPCVGFAGVSGVEDLIIPGRSGLLAQWGGSPNDAVASLAHCLERLMMCAELRIRFGEAGRVRVRDFAPESILAQWDDLIADVLRESRSALSHLGTLPP